MAGAGRKVSRTKHDPFAHRATFSRVKRRARPLGDELRDALSRKFDDELPVAGESEELTSTLEPLGMKDLAGFHSFVGGDEVLSHHVEEFLYRGHSVTFTRPFFRIAACPDETGPRGVKRDHHHFSIVFLILREDWSGRCDGTTRRRYAESMALRLRPYRPDDESAALAAQEELLVDDFHFLLGWDTTMSWPNFLRALDEQRRGVGLAENQVRAVQLVADVDGELVGRVSVRFELNSFLATTGGHIGYAVVPAHRKKGYATEILRQALVVIRAEGVDRVLVTCHDQNVGSSRVIEKCGGTFESIVPLEPEQSLCHDNGQSVRRYWIG